MRIVVQHFSIVLPIVIVIVTDQIDFGIPSGDSGIVRRAVMTVWTDIQFESQVVQVRCLEESFNKLLYPMEWSHSVCRKTTCRAIEIVSKAVFASIRAWSRFAHHTKSIRGWSFQANDFKHQRLSNLQVLS